MNEIIENVDLSRFCINGSNKEEMNMLINGIKSKPGLIELNLAENGLGDSGAKMLGEYLKEDKKIIGLNIKDNMISPAGIDYISGGLRENNTIENIDISFNYVGDISGGNFILSLNGLNNIKTLKMNGALIGSGTVEALVEYIKSHPSLEEVQMKSNGISGEAYDIFIEAQKVNPNCRINVKYNDFNEAQEKILSKNGNILGFFPIEEKNEVKNELCEVINFNPETLDKKNTF